LMLLASLRSIRTIEIPARPNSETINAVEITAM